MPKFKRKRHGHNTLGGSTVRVWGAAFRDSDIDLGIGGDVSQKLDLDHISIYIFFVILCGGFSKCISHYFLLYFIV